MFHPNRPSKYDATGGQDAGSSPPSGQHLSCDPRSPGECRPVGPRHVLTASSPWTICTPQINPVPHTAAWLFGQLPSRYHRRFLYTNCQGTLLNYVLLSPSFFSGAFNPAFSPSLHSTMTPLSHFGSCKLVPDRPTVHLEATFTKL